MGILEVENLFLVTTVTSGTRIGGTLRIVRPLVNNTDEDLLPDLRPTVATIMAMIVIVGLLLILLIQLDSIILSSITLLPLLRPRRCLLPSEVVCAQDRGVRAAEAVEAE